jgi:hypothetical protein
MQKHETHANLHTTYLATYRYQLLQHIYLPCCSLGILSNQGTAEVFALETAQLLQSTTVTATLTHVPVLASIR